jgi:hypothetical protein
MRPTKLAVLIHLFVSMSLYAYLPAAEASVVYFASEVNLIKNK